MIKSILVWMFFLSIIITDSVANSFSADSSSVMDTRWKYYPEGVIAAGLDDSVMCSLTQLGLGVLLQIDSNFSMYSALHVSAFFRDSAVVPSQWFSFGCNFSQELRARLRFNILGSINVGSIGSKYQSSVQTVLGFRIAYVISSIATTDCSHGGIEAFVCSGYGVDFLLDQNQGFLNVGVSILDWLSMSFDVLSIAYPSNAVMNMGRLR